MKPLKQYSEGHTINKKEMVDENVTIVNRFFECLQRLKEEKVIRGVQTFTKTHGINRRNLYTLQHAPERGMFQVSWLAFLVRDYMVSPLWLLTGEGSFFLTGWDAEKVKKMQSNGK